MIQNMGQCEIDIYGSKYKCKKVLHDVKFNFWFKRNDCELYHVKEIVYELIPPLILPYNLPHNFVVKETINGKPHFTACYASNDRKYAIEC
jgi:hypothetical protein